MVMASTLSRFLFRIVIPWCCTIGALYVCSQGMEWGRFAECLRGVNIPFLILPIVLTALSYVLRSMRWRLLFPRTAPSLKVTYKALVFGFFMNNVLPARAGELVRAHVGARLSRESRSLVLATIVAERILDGLALSLLLTVASLSIHGATYTRQLQYVGFAFGGAALFIVLFLSQRQIIERLLNTLEAKISSRTVVLFVSKSRHFIDGLAPLFCYRRLPLILFWTSAVWLLELSVFWLVSSAFAVQMSAQQAIFFLVSSNFASLIPAAPGGIGIVEAVSSAVLVSLGFDREISIAMALSQHVIQYVMVGIPGLYLMLRFRELRSGPSLTDRSDIT